VSLLLLAWPATLLAQAEPSDPEVAEGVRLVQEGDYDAAILTLDRAAERLAEDPAQTRNLSRAYLYLGIAYLGKGHEAAAKAKFREAVQQIDDLSLSPEEFAPKVIDLFEAAKEEARKEAPAPPPEVPEEEKGGSKTPLILVGVGGAAAAGVAVAAGGGDSGSEPPPGPPVMVTEVFPGLLNRQQYYGEVRVGPGGAGRWEAQLTWTNADAVVEAMWMEIKNSNMRLVAEGRLLTATSFVANWDGEGTFLIDFGFDKDIPGPPPGAYELRVTFPRP
jgi:hypothetical protein